MRFFQGFEMICTEKYFRFSMEIEKQRECFLTHCCHYTKLLIFYPATQPKKQKNKKTQL